MEIYDAIGGRLPNPMKKERLLAEVEDLLRTMPSVEDFDKRSEESGIWIGRTAAVLKRWQPSRWASFDLAMEQSVKPLDRIGNVSGRMRLQSLLREAQADLRMDVGPVSVVVQPGQVFDYFDELRKVIEPARSDIFFVDPYLDAEFVSRYLPFVASGTVVRLLASKRVQTLLPAVTVFSTQTGLKVHVRSTPDIHDRYLFVDRSACYVSGASFKDGAKKSPVVLTQIVDAFKATWDTYDGIWTKANVEM